MTDRRIAVVILNYKSWSDTTACIESIQNSDYSELMTIIVDNASNDGSVGNLLAWLREKQLPVRHLTTNQVNALLRPSPAADVALAKGEIALVEVECNCGYSAGNNVGIKLALSHGAEAVLIVNPDVRIEAPEAIRALVDTMFASDDIFVVGPNIITGEGRRQNPQREPSPTEEAFYPLMAGLLRKLGREPNYFLEPLSSACPHPVEKVAGCCLLIRSSFLQAVGLLDESVFLYCEEAILAAQVKATMGTLYFHPEVKVQHLHRPSYSPRLDLMMQSRRYYLKRYAGLNVLQYGLIRLSQLMVLTMFNFRRARAGKDVSGGQK